MRRLFEKGTTTPRPLWLLLQSLVLLLMRLELAWVFIRSGLTKLDDWSITLALFTDEYHVPLLAPQIAAPLATAGELLLPSLLLLGWFGRWAAFGLLGLNVMAVISYWHGLTTPTGGLTPALLDHWQWGIYLLALLAFGPGKASVDEWRARLIKF